jgi:hypothetical protein
VGHREQAVVVRAQAAPAPVRELAQVVAVAAELVLAAPEAARAVPLGLEARKEQRQAGG